MVTFLQRVGMGLKFNDSFLILISDTTQKGQTHPSSRLHTSWEFPSCFIYLIDNSGGIPWLTSERNCNLAPIGITISLVGSILNFIKSVLEKGKKPAEPSGRNLMPVKSFFKKGTEEEVDDRARGIILQQS